MITEQHVAPLIDRGRSPTGEERHDLDHGFDLDPRLDLDHDAALQEGSIESEDRFLRAEVLGISEVGIETVRGQSFDHRRNADVRAESGEIGKVGAETAVEHNEANRSRQSMGLQALSGLCQQGCVGRSG